MDTGYGVGISRDVVLNQPGLDQERRGGGCFVSDVQ